MAFNPQSGMSAASVSAYDQEKFLSAKLIERAHMKLVAASVCDKVKQPKGTGTTAYFVRYSRMNVPVTELTEGTPPSNSTYSLEQTTVTLDQWGDVITITDVAKLSTSHPLWQQAMELLLDNAQRLIDREVQNVWLAGTNVVYPSTYTARSSITSSDKITQELLHKVRINLVQDGVPTRDGPSNMRENAKGGAATGSLMGGGHYLAICGPEVMADVMAISSGLWAGVAQYQNAKAIYNAEVGTFLGFRFVETNFIPKFEILGNLTAAAAAGADAGGITGLTTASVNGGSLANATTYYWKVTRKSLTRGFEEAISIIHSTATGASDESLSFTMPSTAGYVYNVYFGDTNANSDLFLVTGGENIAASGSVTVSAVPTSGTNPPVGPGVAAGTPGTSDPDVHPIFFFGKGACAWVGLQELQTFVSGDKAEKSDPLNQVQTMGYKFMGKAVILDQDRILRLEVASAYSL